MNDDYLWDGSGEPDPEIRKLETTLGRFRHQGPVPEFPRLARARQPRFWRFVAWRWSFGLRAATATIVFIGALGILWWSAKPNSSAGPGWDVERVAGTPKVESNAFLRKAGTSKLGVGQTLVTDSHSKANISIAAIGTVDVEPNTRLRAVGGGPGQNRLALDRGTIHAFIWASPGEFTVDTPSAIAVDLGCSYTLHVDDSGAGILRTQLGWVGFKLNGHEAFIPAGAACATRPKTGPGTPYFEDASLSFREALSKLDFAAGTPEERSAELSKVLAEARQRDALTVWHLLVRISGPERGAVYDRLATLVPPPAEVTRDGILRLDQKMMDLWWNHLGLGDISLWRTWERSWSPAKT
jgi:FecR protein